MTLRNIALKAGFAAVALVMGSAAAYAASAQATGSVNVRSGPGTSYRVVDQLFRGENVDVSACQGGWCRITHSGPDGWVSASYLGRNVRVDDDEYYDERYYGDPDIIVRAPRYHRSYPHYRGYPRYRGYDYGDYYDDGYYYGQPRGSVCIGSNNANLCIGN